MLDLELFFKEKTTIPDWFKTHPIFKDVTKVNKIFPSIGLPNFSIESDLKNDNAKDIKALCIDMKMYVDSVIFYFNDHIRDILNAPNNRYVAGRDIVQQFSHQLSKHKNYVAQFASKGGLYLPNNIIGADKSIFAKQGESLFKAYAKLKIYLAKHYDYNIQRLEDLNSFKTYSSNNVSGKLKIVFSSDNMDGAWDLLTMSQRGISSCQSWTGQYKNCTIGSVIDPFTAIIYLTSGSKTDFGTKMMRRCIVRFVVNEATKRPCLFLEYMYPSEHAATLAAFKKAIRDKIGDKFPLISQRTATNKYYVPYSNEHGSLLKHSNHQFVNRRGHHNYYGIFPYRDTFMEYKMKPTSSIEDRIGSLLIVQKSKCVKALNDTSISNNYITLIDNVIRRDLFDKVDSKSCVTVNDYMKQVCMKYFININTFRTNLCAEIKNEMKKCKDKSIFVPGANQAIQSASKKKADMLENIVSAHIIPIISNNFKSAWKDLMGVKTKKNISKRPKLIKK